MASTAIVIDLPASASIGSVPALIRNGYRPVPLYNAVPGSGIASHARSMSRRSSSGILAFTSVVRQTLPYRPEAPPAFLLDADRRIARPGVSMGPGVFSIIGR